MRALHRERGLHWLPSLLKIRRHVVLQVHEEATDKRKAKVDQVASLRDEVGSPLLALRSYSTRTLSDRVVWQDKALSDKLDAMAAGGGDAKVNLGRQGRCLRDASRQFRPRCTVFARVLLAGG